MAAACQNSIQAYMANLLTAWQLQQPGQSPWNFLITNGAKIAYSFLLSMSFFAGL